MINLRLYFIYETSDTQFVQQLLSDIKNFSIDIEVQQFKYSGINEGNDEEALNEADIVLAVVSPEANNSIKMTKKILAARETGKYFILLKAKNAENPTLLHNRFVLDFWNDYNKSLNDLKDELKLLFKKKISETTMLSPMVGCPAPAAQKSVSREIISAPSPSKKNIFNTIVKSLNPFRKKNINYSSAAADSKSSNRSITTGNTSDSFPDYKDAATAAPSSKPSAGSQHTTKAKPPVASAMPKPAPQKALPTGKILYDIPDNMQVNHQQKCIVRIGKTEAIVRDDDIFSGAEKIEDVPIARVMNVELVDINDPKCFIVKTINSAEQEVDSNSFSEWLFWVTPLKEGKFSLWLKVSVIRIIDGKERRKEIVLEKDINIAALPAQQTVNSNSDKDLLSEKKAKELDSPTVFVSYAHKDKNYFDVFLRDLDAQSGWDIRTDKNIIIGENWYNSIQQAIKETDMAVLLVSANFFSSEFINQNEFEKFADLSKEKSNFIFLPVLLRDADINRWQDLSKLQFFSADGDDYNVPSFKGKLMPFAALCSFNTKGELNENSERDTYFKNFVAKANEAWMKANKLKLN